MAHSRSWYFNLSDRAQIYENTSYPYTDESLEQARVIKELRTALRELLDENGKQAAEIAGLKELLKKPTKPKGKLAEKHRGAR